MKKNDKDEELSDAKRAAKLALRNSMGSVEDSGASNKPAVVKITKNPPARLSTMSSHVNANDTSKAVDQKPLAADVNEVHEAVNHKLTMAAQRNTHIHDSITDDSTFVQEHLQTIAREQEEERRRANKDANNGGTEEDKKTVAAPTTEEDTAKTKEKYLRDAAVGVPIKDPQKKESASATKISIDADKELKGQIKSSSATFMNDSTSDNNTPSATMTDLSMASSVGAYRVAGIDAADADGDNISVPFPPPPTSTEHQENGTSKLTLDQANDDLEQQPIPMDTTASEFLVEARLVTSKLKLLDMDDSSNEDNGDQDSSVYSVAVEVVNVEQHETKRKWRFAEALVLVVLVAVGITVGGFCGSGACSRSESSSSDDGNTVGSPTMAPSLLPIVATTPSPVPVVSTWAPGAMPDLVIDNLPDYTLVALKDPTSPQTKAHLWVANDPYLANYTNDRLLQRFALATLYMATGGDSSWRTKDGWLDYNKSECTWYQKMDLDWYPEFNSSRPCYENTSTYRYLTPWDNRLKGQIPSELELLTDLLNLDISNGIFENSTIPTQLGSMTNLRKLFLNDHANLVGTIPTELGRLTQLDILFLSDTGLTGTIPSQIGLLTNLGEVHLGFTSLSGVVPTEVCALLNATLILKESMVTCPKSCAQSCGAS